MSFDRNKSEYVDPVTRAEDFQSFNRDEFSSYESYLITEWELFKGDSSRYRAFLAFSDEVAIKRVVDVGCGAGQEMLPFVSNGAFGCGLDYVPETGSTGRRLYEAEGLADRVTFVRGTGDLLPFGDSSYDVVICRGSIMFMDNERAISEFARVLNEGGLLFLMFQAPAYYWWKFRTGIFSGRLLSAVHAARVLYGGTVFALTGRQPRGRLTAGGEVFETRNYVVRTAERYGLTKLAEMPDSNPKTPFIVFAKNPTGS